MSEDAEGVANFAEAMRQLRDTAERGAKAISQWRDWLILLAAGLDDWNDEMDNCYPNWPDG